KVRAMEPHQRGEPVAYGRKWYVMAAVGMSIFLATLDLSIVNVALPTLVRDLRTDFPTVQWVILAYSLALATLLLSVGRLGGLLIDALSWHWIFMVNVPIGLVGTLVAMRYVPAIPPTGGQRFDYLGAITFCLSLLGLLLALTLGQQAGFTQPLILLLFAAWLV